MLRWGKKMNATPGQAVPHVMAQPGDNLILFDGVCNLCTASVQFIIRHDRRAVFRFAAIQSDLGREIYRTAGLDPADSRTFLVRTQGRTLIRSDAVLAVAEQLGGWWRLLAIFKLMPRAWRDWLYALVARRRYAWFRQRDSCMIPSEKVRGRFLA